MSAPARRQLGFKLEGKRLPAFAEVSIGDLKLILSGPGASGSRPTPDGRRQEPDGNPLELFEPAH